jgi:hypothetical protein
MKMAVFGMLRRVDWYEFIDVLEVLTALIDHKLEVVRAFETSVNFCQTKRHNFPKTVIFILAAVRT